MITKMAMGGGSASANETPLWTNGSPTSTQGDTTVTISDSLTNYDELRINYRNSTSDSFERYATISVSKLLNDANTYYFYFGGYNGSSAMMRFVKYVSSTSIRIGPTSQVGGTSSDNTRYIVTSLVGIKY